MNNMTLLMTMFGVQDISWRVCERGIALWYFIWSAGNDLLICVSDLFHNAGWCISGHVDSTATDQHRISGSFLMCNISKERRFPLRAMIFLQRGTQPAHTPNNPHTSTRRRCRDKVPFTSSFTLVRVDLHVFALKLGLCEDFTGVHSSRGLSRSAGWLRKRRQNICL